MGTRANVLLVVADSIAGLAAAGVAHASLAFVDSLTSGRSAASEVARLNREGGSGTTPVHPEVARLLETALAVHRESAGAFDVTAEPLMRAWGFAGGTPRVPPAAEADSARARVGAQHLAFDPYRRTLRFGRSGMAIGLGSLAGGYAVDRAAAGLVEAGVRDALVDLSGTAAALGRSAAGGRWRVGVRDHRDPRADAATLVLDSGEAIATAGGEAPLVTPDGTVYGRIIDPRAGRPAGGLISATVIAPSATLADAWSRALFVLGPAEAMRIARAREDLAAVLIAPGAGGVDTVWVESALLERIALEPPAAGRLRIESY